MKNKLLLLAMGLALTTQMIIAQVPSYVPTNGLVGYWPFNGNANDVSGNGNNGTVNGAVLTSDRFGDSNKAFSFDGLTNYINCGNNSNLQLNNFTISLWANLDSSSENWNDINGGGFFIHKGCDNTLLPYNGYSYRIFYQNPYGLLAEQYVNDRAFLDNNVSNIIKLWSHIVFSYDGKYLNIYYNGIQIDSLARNGITAINNNDLLIGCRKELKNSICTLDDFFKGYLDDIGIWNRALTQDEITSLYQSEVSCQSLVINSGTLSSFNPAVYQSTITIYPNPAKDQITIDCGNLANVSGWNIKIFNTLSQEVFSGAMNQQQYTIPLNTWGGQGVYFVKIYDASNNLMNTKKIILQ